MSTMLDRRRKTPMSIKGGKRSMQDRTQFTPETFEILAKELQDGTLPLPRVTLSDTEGNGLRAIIRPTGRISYHVHYRAAASRPYMKIGDHVTGDPKNSMSLKDARKVAATIQALADKGIDPQQGLHERLVRELLEKGDKWRP